MNNKLQKEIKRLRNLPQYKNKSESFLEEKANINLKKKEFNVGSKFSDTNEKRLAKNIYEQYIENYDLDSINDLNILQDLVYHEILQKRFEDEFNRLHKNSLQPRSQLTQQYHQVIDKITELKRRIGIEGQENEVDELNGLEMLKKRFEKYINANKHEFTTICAKCGNLLLLRRRVKDFNCLKHPFFSGRWLYNIEIINDVKNGKITAEQASRYLKTSPDYIQWCIEHEDEIIEENEDQ